VPCRLKGCLAEQNYDGAKNNNWSSAYPHSSRCHDCTAAALVRLLREEPVHAEIP